MTRIERIITNARRVLADKEQERWSDEDLLSILDEGQKDLCQQAKILRGRATVPLSFDTPFFSLPDNCWQLTRVTFNNTVIPFMSYTQLDSAAARSDTLWGVDALTNPPSADWQDDTGNPEAIIYDRRDMNEARIYPTPTTEQAVPAIFSDVFGVITQSVLSRVTPIFGISDTVGGEEAFGVLTSMPVPPSLGCYFLETPADITSLEDELVTPRMFDTALKYYVIGNAFLMDLDQEYQAKGVQQLGFYSRDLEVAIATAERDFQQAAATRTTYRTI